MERAGSRMGRGRAAAVACAVASTWLALGAACGGGDEPATGGAPDARPTDPPSVGTVGSARGGTRPATRPTERAGALADSTDWTIGALSGTATLEGTPPVPVLTALRAGVHSEYERVTLELAGAGGLPGYRIEYVDRPLYDCGSGEPTYPVGDAWLEIRLEPAAAHTEEGRPTLGVRDLAVGQPLLQRIYRTCDFEAIVTHVLALSEPNAFRVMRLADPPRIVVDVQR